MSNAIQYTLRCIPPELDAALRARAEKEGKSLNQVTIEAIRLGLGEMGTVVYRDLDDLIGKWVPDPEFDKAIQDQDQIDEDMWR